MESVLIAISLAGVVAAPAFVVWFAMGGRAERRAERREYARLVGGV